MTPEGRRILRDVAVALALALAAVLVTTRWVAVPWSVEGASMAPTLRPGDRVVVEVWSYRRRAPRPGEIALFEGPGGRAMVKRIASVSPGRGVWVLGDNPTASVDSRAFGAVPRDRFRGRVVWRYWPLGRAGAIR